MNEPFFVRQRALELAHQLATHQTRPEHNYTAQQIVAVAALFERYIMSEIVPVDLPAS